MVELYKIAGAEKRKAKHMLCMCLCYGDPQRDVVCAQTTTASQDRPDRHPRLKTKSPGYENERCPRMRSPLITMHSTSSQKHRQKRLSSERKTEFDYLSQSDYWLAAELAKLEVPLDATAASTTKVHSFL